MKEIISKWLEYGKERQKQTTIRKLIKHRQWIMSSDYYDKEVDKVDSLINNLLKTSI